MLGQCFSLSPTFTGDCSMSFPFKLIKTTKDIYMPQELVPEHFYEFNCADAESKTISLHLFFKRLENPFYITTITLIGMDNTSVSKIAIKSGDKSKIYEHLQADKSQVTLNQFFNTGDEIVAMTIDVPFSNTKRNVEITFKWGKNHHKSNKINIPVPDFEDLQNAI